MIRQAALDPSAEHRAIELDALSAILPIDRRDQLALLLSDDDIATLKHLAQKGMGANTLRALASDLGYLEAWSQVATGTPLPWPAPAALILKFIAHHLWDPIEKSQNQQHGMPEDVRTELERLGMLRVTGPHAPATVKRRLALWATLHRWKGLQSHLHDPEISAALRLTIRATPRPRARKSDKAITLDILDKLIATCWRVDLIDIRDKAILLTGFASGGRRRSENANLLVCQLRQEPPAPADPNNPSSPKLICLSLLLGRTKTETMEQEDRVYLVGRSAEALRFWIEAAKIKEGPVFRALGPWGKLSARPITPTAINDVIKRRCRLARLDPKEFSAHGLRSGYLTEASRQKVPLLEAMQQSRHKSVQQASRYYNDAERVNGHAVRLAEG